MDHSKNATQPRPTIAFNKAAVGFCFLLGMGCPAGDAVPTEPAQPIGNGQLNFMGNDGENQTTQDSGSPSDTPPQTSNSDAGNVTTPPNTAADAGGQGSTTGYGGDQDSGYGNGYGYGYDSGYGNGYGYGYDSGYGGYGYGSGYDSGYGGYGDGGY